jgi:hypothetical protein
MMTTNPSAIATRFEMPLWKRGCNRRNSGRDADGDGKHVIDQKRPSRYKRRRLAKILLRDDVGAATARVRVNRLAVRENHHRENCGDDKRDRAGQAERADADENQDAEDFLGRIRHRGKRVGGQHRQAREPRQSLMMGKVRRNGLTDNQLLEL